MTFEKIGNYDINKIGNNDIYYIGNNDTYKNRKLWHLQKSEIMAFAKIGNYDILKKSEMMTFTKS